MVGFYNDDLIPDNLDDDKINGLEFVNVNISKNYTKDIGLIWNAEISLKLTTTTGVIPTSISVGIYFHS